MFFTYSSQIRIPDDYAKFLLSVDNESGIALMDLLRGPMWSGLPENDIGNPLKVALISNCDKISHIVLIN